MYLPMLVALIVFCFCLIPPGATSVAAFSISVPATVVAGTSAIVQWQAEASNPDVFTLVFLGLGHLDPFSNVTRTAGQLEGSATTPPLGSPGPYYVGAISNGEALTLGFKSIKIVEPADTASPQLSSSSMAAPQSGESTSPTRTLGPTSRSSSQASIISTIPISSAGHISGLNSSSSQSLSIATSIPSRASIMISQQSSTSSSLSTPLNKHNYTPVIVGSVLAVTIILGLLTGALFIRHRRNRLLNITVSPYKPSVSQNTRTPASIPRVVLITKKNRIHINIPDNITANSIQIPSKKKTSMRAVVSSGEIQTSLQPPAVETEVQLAESQAAPDVSPGFARALITENIRLNEENQVLRDLNRSEWEVGLTGVSPPSYPHSQISSL
ncbi:hypothetical protein C8J56DRAFT_1159711 [Mycena floridula]|nr:hypothetical protein C8J56DRAFT_1159711 [Mycena floridula]